MAESRNLFIRSERKDARIGKPFVTISYEVGAYGVVVVENLCEFLQKRDNRKENAWKVFDKDLVKKVIEEYNLPKSIVPYFSESTVSEIEDIVESAVGLYPSRYTLVYEMNQTILRLAKSGSVIIVGRGANIVTAKISKGAHIRLVGSLDNRILYIKQHLKISEKEAIKFIIKENRRRSNYFKKYFDRNINDPLLYDLVINTDRLSIQDIVREIGSLIIKRETFATTGILEK